MVHATDNELRRTVEGFLAAGVEVRRFEAKGPGSTGDKHFTALVARAAMAMGNLRDGGMVCIGIDDAALSTMLPGLAPAELEQWSDADTVADKLAAYSDPPVTLSVRPLTLSNGVDVVVLMVEEFDVDIHVCKRDMQSVLQVGQTYVRPRGKPRSAQVPSLAEMRELHDLAIDKGVRAFVRRAAAAGLLGELDAGPPPGPAELDAAQFEREAELAWRDPTPISDPARGTLRSGLSSGAYFDVKVRPGPYASARISPTALESFIAQRAVSLRGWPVPMVGGGQRVEHLGHWIRQDLQGFGALPHAEAWRLFTSGQFLHRRFLATDLSDSADLRSETPGATGAVAIWDVLLYMAEVAELGARIATGLEAADVTFLVGLRNVAGRDLVSGDPRRRSSRSRSTSASDLSHSVRLTATELVADPRKHGVDLAQGLLSQFGAEIEDQTLLDWAEQFLDGP